MINGQPLLTTSPTAAGCSAWAGSVGVGSAALVQSMPQPSAASSIGGWGEGLGDALPAALPGSSSTPPSPASVSASVSAGSANVAVACSWALRSAARARRRLAVERVPRWVARFWRAASGGGTPWLGPSSRSVTCGAILLRDDFAFCGLRWGATAARRQRRCAQNAPWGRRVRLRLRCRAGPPSPSRQATL